MSARFQRRPLPEANKTRPGEVHLFTHEVNPNDPVPFHSMIDGCWRRRGKYFSAEQMGRNGYTYLMSDAQWKQDSEDAARARAELAVKCERECRFDALRASLNSALDLEDVQERRAVMRMLIHAAHRLSSPK